MRQKIISWLILLCAVFQVLDGTLTGIGLSYLPEGIDAEGNPLIRYIVSELGIVTGLVLVKGLAVIVLLAIRASILKRPPQISFLIVCILLNLAYTYAVFSWIYLYLDRGGYL